MTVSIVIPVLNEASTLPALLEHLARLHTRGVADIVLVDGGSTDGSREILSESGYTLTYSDPGRAKQMNAGAAVASGDLLLFLHADTRLPDLDFRILEKRLYQARGAWGRFDVQIAGRSKLLPVVAVMTNFRSRLTGIATGDQCLFIKRDLFEELGGFPDQPLMEDVELCKRLNKTAKPLCLRQRVVTSGRRWDERGAWKTILLMWQLRWAYWRGVSPSLLKTRYR